MEIAVSLVWNNCHTQEDFLCVLRLKEVFVNATRPERVPRPLMAGNELLNAWWSELHLFTVCEASGWACGVASQFGVPRYKFCHLCLNSRTSSTPSACLPRKIKTNSTHIMAACFNRSVRPPGNSYPHTLSPLQPPFPFSFLFLMPHLPLPPTSHG